MPPPPVRRGGNVRHHRAKFNQRATSTRQPAGCRRRRWGWHRGGAFLLSVFYDVRFRTLLCLAAASMTACGASINAVYEGEYLLGTSIARPRIAKHLVEIARRTGADAISHGATGKGNDQVRFELGAYALMPDVRIIAPWREWDLTSREKLLAYAKVHRIPVDYGRKKGAAPYSMDANLLHISYEGGILEDPRYEPEESMWRITVSPEKAPSRPEYVELAYSNGDIVAVNGRKMTPAQILAKLNQLAGKHGIGRLDLVENRYVGMKSRGCYETPGGTIMLKAHRAMESITLDREVLALEDDLMPRYARLIYNGYWFSPERRLLQTLIDAERCGKTR